MAQKKLYLIGQKRMNHVISHQKGVKRSVLGVAREIGAIAQGRLAGHRDTGRARIEVSQGDTDAFASLVDEAALSIEFGHYLGRQELGTGRRFIRGLHLFIDWYHDGIV